MNHSPCFDAQAEFGPWRLPGRADRARVLSQSVPWLQTGIAVCSLSFAFRKALLHLSSLRAADNLFSGAIHARLWRKKNHPFSDTSSCVRLSVDAQVRFASGMLTSA